MNLAKAAPAVRERPITFSGPMVQAILDRRKTQTRRIATELMRTGVRREGGVDQWWTGFMGWQPIDLSEPPPLKCLRCPYGVPGDRLWVKETWRQGDGSSLGNSVFYRADPDEQPARGLWRSSRFMPRWASRITLEVTRRRVQRLQDITRDECIAEGIERKPWYLVDGGPEKWFRVSWDHINGQRASWKSNPWVWVVDIQLLSVRS